MESVSAHHSRHSLFTIDHILGRDRDEQRTIVYTPHRPWTDAQPPKNDRFIKTAGSPEVPVMEERKSEAPVESCRRSLNWCIGRRPRTAFSSLQIEILESVFQVNSYPGIDVREELAQKLHIDEDRIQIWFQNRRAKLKRSHRENQFLMVKKVITGLKE
ncbi:homeobox expressed in ES cells 1 [Tachysurus fulvidraco]|uniref:homeobox expressed in ES cells 1 n=1 Tax=Tachysurus fulvidraco TaxID=1234273 RepID=UPI000F4FEED8|nr:homeobox expressed in ES cells 1 [Tachysurus fulvidraco]